MKGFWRLVSRRTLRGQRQREPLGQSAACRASRMTRATVGEPRMRCTIQALLAGQHRPARPRAPARWLHRAASWRTPNTERPTVHWAEQRTRPESCPMDSHRWRLISSGMATWSTPGRGPRTAPGPSRPPEVAAKTRTPTPGQVDAEATAQTAFPRWRVQHRVGAGPRRTKSPSDLKDTDARGGRPTQALGMLRAGRACVFPRRASARWQQPQASNACTKLRPGNSAGLQPGPRPRPVQPPTTCTPVEERCASLQAFRPMAVSSDSGHKMSATTRSRPRLHVRGIMNNTLPHPSTTERPLSLSWAPA